MWKSRMSRELRVLAGLALVFGLAYPQAWAQTQEKPPLFKLNDRIIWESDPIWDLLRKDSLVASVGRFALQVGSGIETLKRGYHHKMGAFEFQVKEADIGRAGVPGLRTGVAWNLAGDTLKLDYMHDTPLSGSARQQANLIFQIRL